MYPKESCLLDNPVFTASTVGYFIELGVKSLCLFARSSGVYSKASVTSELNKYTSPCLSLKEFTPVDVFITLLIHV